MTKPISEMTIDEKALTALTEAVRKAQERQWRLGLNVWVWRDGKVVALPPPPHLRFPPQAPAANRSNKEGTP